jgi:hypothetical protein
MLMEIQFRVKKNTKAFNVTYMKNVRGVTDRAIS